MILSLYSSHQEQRVLFLPIGGMKTASSRLICYENAKYLRELGWDVVVGKDDVTAFDIVVFQKRFRRGDLNLIGTTVSDLGKLETVGGNLDLRKTNVSDLGRLTRVGGTFNLKGTSVDDLGKLEKIDGYVYLDKYKEYILSDTIKDEQIKTEA